MPLRLMIFDAAYDAIDADADISRRYALILMLIR